jgi:hypothetical protein
VAQEGDDVPRNMSTANQVHLTHRVLPDTGNVQELVYGECLDKLRALDDPPTWVMVLDGDEFLVFRDMDKYPNVVTFLTEQLHSGSLQINWVVMGSANETVYRDEPVTKRFQLALGGSQYLETKAVAILDHVTGWRVHYAYHKPGYGAVGMGGRKVGFRGALLVSKMGMCRFRQSFTTSTKVLKSSIASNVKEVKSTSSLSTLARPQHSQGMCLMILRGVPLLVSCRNMRHCRDGETLVARWHSTV